MEALADKYRLCSIARTSHLNEFPVVFTLSRLITGCISGMLPVALALLPWLGLTMYEWSGVLNRRISYEVLGDGSV